MRAENAKAAGRVLTYVDAVPGRLYPLVATLVELAARGHRVAVRCGIDDVERLRALGLEARPLRSEIERFAPDDWRARTRSAPSARGSRSSANGRRSSCAISSRRSKSSSPTFSSSTKAPGAPPSRRSAPAYPGRSRSSRRFRSPLAMRRRSGSASRRAGQVGRWRDRIAERLTLGTLERVIASHLNPLRAELGLPPVATIEDVYLAASAVRLHGGAVRVPALGLAGKAQARRPRPLGAAGRPTRLARGTPAAAGARHLLDTVPERPQPR